MAEQLEDGAVVSRHYYRRTARRKAAKLNETRPGAFYTVRPATRGPYRWYVRRWHTHQATVTITERDELGQAPSA